MRIAETRVFEFPKWSGQKIGNSCKRGSQARRAYLFSLVRINHFPLFPNENRGVFYTEIGNFSSSFSQIFIAICWYIRASLVISKKQKEDIFESEISQRFPCLKEGTIKLHVAALGIFFWYF